MTMRFDKADSGSDDEARVAEALQDDLRKTYGDDVTIALRRATITIARGKRAAQIQVLRSKPTMEGRRFQVSLRRNETFHMRPEPVDRETMVGLVHKMVGEIS